MSEEHYEKKITRQISQLLMTQSYISLKELQEQFSENNVDIMQILEELQESFDKVGIQLEIIDLDEVEYVVITVKTSAPTNRTLTAKEYTVLGLFAQLIKLQGNGIAGKEIYQLFRPYWEEISVLQKHRLIEQTYSQYEEKFYLTPLGGVIIAPVMPKIQILLENMKKSAI